MCYMSVLSVDVTFRIASFVLGKEANFRCDINKYHTSTPLHKVPGHTGHTLFWNGVRPK